MIRAYTVANIEEWRKRVERDEVKMLAQLCTPTYEMWSEVFPTGPEETLSRLRSLVGRTWIDPKTIRHFPVRRIIFFFLFSFSFSPQNNQSKRERSKNRHVHRSQKSGESDFYLFFVVCTVHEASRSIDKHNVLTDIPPSSCIVRTSFFFLLFIFFFPSIVSVSQEIGCFRIIKQRKICMRCAKATFERITRFYSRVSCILVFFQEKFDCLRLFTRILSKYILFDIICTTKRIKLKVWDDFGAIVSFFFFFSIF